VREILIIEDTESDALLLERVLRSFGICNRIHRATTGAEALLYLNAKAQSGPGKADVGIIFFDLRLPDITGLELLRIVSQRKAFSATLKVVVSQLGDMEVIRRAYNLGADTFIAKPPNALDVRELIRSFPENWILADQPVNKETLPAQESSDEVVSLLDKHRELIETLRENIKALIAQLHNPADAIEIIETLSLELRTSGDIEQQPRQKN
jgi:CheY-like chemotaxis protein